MGGGGVKKSQILAYVLYGWSHILVFNFSRLGLNEVAECFKSGTDGPCILIRSVLYVKGAPFEGVLSQEINERALTQLLTEFICET